MRRQWQIIGHELAASFDRNNVRKFFFGQCFELLFGGKAFIGDHRVLLAGDAAFVEYVGKRTDVRGADEKLLVIHRSAGIGGKAVDIEQIDLWLEAPLRVVSQLCQFHGFGGSDQSLLFTSSCMKRQIASRRRPRTWRKAALLGASKERLGRRCARRLVS